MLMIYVIYMLKKHCSSSIIYLV